MYCKTLFVVVHSQEHRQDGIFFKKMLCKIAFMNLKDRDELMFVSRGPQSL